jgi:hypothetical protein
MISFSFSILQIILLPPCSYRGESLIPFCIFNIVIISTSVYRPDEGLFNDPTEIEERFGKQLDLVIDGGPTLNPSMADSIFETGRTGNIHH